MIFDARNRATIKELAPNTQVAALKWYEHCVANKVELLICDGLRTLEEQKAFVARGASKTMRSYHLVGQALDFVPIDKAGKAVWVVAAYKKEPYKSAVAYAKELGFEWGGDWTKFNDSPHLQFNYKGYGTDKAIEVKTIVNKDVHTVEKGDTLWAIARKNNVGIEKIKSINGLRTDVITIGQKLNLKEAVVVPKPVPKPTSVIPFPGVVEKGDKGKDVERIQRALNIAVDGSFGPGTEKAVKAYQTRKGLKADGMVGPNTWYVMF